MSTQPLAQSGDLGLVAEARDASPAPLPFRALRRLLAKRGPVIALTYLGLLLLAAALAFLSPYPSDAILGSALEPPSLSHPLGTDDIGRDVLTRMLYGTRTTLAASVQLITLAVIIGCGVGLVSGYFGGSLDYVLMRVIDATMSIPPLVMAMAIVAALGPGLMNAMVGLAIVFAPGFARLVRTQVAAVREEPFIEAARSLALTDRRLMLKHVLPNIAPILLVQVTIVLAHALLAQTALDFLGLSIQPPTPSWGNMLQRAFTVNAQAPWLILIPGIAITLTVWAFNVLGDGLRDAYSARG